ncbi:hypothetical protein [Methylorubrum extorquens]|uniref:Uncharacterized protein n=1 Tax=Methylorubrum extorquens (strain CM4 / NCIMB 13688) TaxID=440085 RepID=B7KTG7_METC4|nr:hypothetical protein [Methylorubrum extorquens]ACK82494.1 hypothetical protein Mchl_1630 [Methylorubrum extorquens CM4]
MCAPFSQADQPEPAISSFDLADAVEHLHLAALAYSDVVRKVAIGDATSAQIGPRGSQSANMVRLRLEEAMIALRATCRNAFAGTAGTYASETDLAEAQSWRIQQNDRNINRTAMRRADAAETAERSLIDRAHTVGAELSRLDAAHPYGKSAAPAHGSHEAGFVSPAAA